MSCRTLYCLWIKLLIYKRKNSVFLFQNLHRLKLKAHSPTEVGYHLLACFSSLHKVSFSADYGMYYLDFIKTTECKSKSQMLLNIFIKSTHGGTVVQWWALSRHSKRVLGLNPPADWSPSVWSLHVLLVSASVFWFSPGTPTSSHNLKTCRLG